MILHSIKYMNSELISKKTVPASSLAEKYPNYYNVVKLGKALNAMEAKKAS